MRAMRFLCILSLLFTVFLEFFDMYTDLDFSEEMYVKSLHGSNYTAEVSDCKIALSPIVDTVMKYCKTSFNETKCTDASNALKAVLGRNCSDLSAKLEYREWRRASWVCLADVIAPVAFIFFFTLINIDKRMLKSSFEWAKYLLNGTFNFLFPDSRLKNIFEKLPKALTCCIACIAIPILGTIAILVFILMLLISFTCHFICSMSFPFITKTKQTMIEWKKFELFTKRAEMDKAEFDKKLEEYMEKEEEVQKAEIFSIVVETGLESNFQFWFQTQFILPGLVSNILDYTNDKLDVTDLFNWRIFSILISFVSISWTAVKIR